MPTLIFHFSFGPFFGQAIRSADVLSWVGPRKTGQSAANSTPVEAVTPRTTARHIALPPVIDPVTARSFMHAPLPRISGSSSPGGPTARQQMWQAGLGEDGTAARSCQPSPPL